MSASNHGLLAPANGPATAGDGSMGYNQIRQFIEQNGAVKVCNATMVGDYCYAGTVWIGYDDTQSVSTKASYAEVRLVNCMARRGGLQLGPLLTWMVCMNPLGKNILLIFMFV